MSRINLSNGRNFTAPYVYQEYPKWVEHEGKLVLVKDAREEADLNPQKIEPSGAENVRDALMAQAKSLGLNPHHKTGEDKLRELIESTKQSQQE